MSALFHVFILCQVRAPLITQEKGPSGCKIEF
jgi:hypothetical protein